MQAPMIRTLSYNIHKGYSVGNRRYVLQGMRQALQDLAPDLLLLQEVRGMHLEPGGGVHSQCAYLGAANWPHHAYGRNAVTRAGHHGNAILSRFPILHWENLDISTYELERRGLLHAVLDVPGLKANLHVMCLHLNLFQRGRRKQVESICRRIEKAVPTHEPLILAGDFNDWRQELSGVLEHHAGLREAHREHHGAHARSFPSWLPMLSLDRIYFRGLEPRTTRPLTENPWRSLSDHAPLYSELEVALAKRMAAG